MFFGEKLREKRKEKGVSFFLAERATQVPVKYLAALEEGEFDKLPGKVYAKNFLRSYLKFLQLPEKDFLDEFGREYSCWEDRQRRLVASPSPRQFGQDFFSFFLSYNFFKKILAVFFFLCLFTYLGAEAKDIFSPPWLLINSPQDNSISQNSVIEVKGATEKESAVVINGKKVVVDKNGHFSVKVGLKPGANIIKISSQKKFSQKNNVYLRIFFTKDY